jgi:hypothetical protein
VLRSRPINAFLFEPPPANYGIIKQVVLLVLLAMWYFTIHQQLPYMLRHTPDELFMPTGLMAWWPAQKPVALAVDFVMHTRGLLMTLWFFAAIGLGGRWPLLFTGMLFFVHYGLFKAASGTTHTWHIPLFTILILGFFTCPGEWSIDGLIHRYVRHYPFPVKSAGIWDGFAFKLVMCCSAYVMFAGGVAKLRYGGLDWLNGESLGYFLKEMPVIKGEIGQLLSGFLHKNPFMIRVLSVWTIGLELSAPLVLFFMRFRWPFVLNAWAFHIGIYLLMSPRYFPQMTVYLLFLNIPGIAGSIESKSAVILAPKISRMSTWLATGMISFLLIVFVWIIVAAREPFPLSHVPMYGNRMTDEYIGDFKRSSLRTLKGYQLAGRQYLQDEQPWYLYVHTGRMLDVEVWNGHKWAQLGKSFIQGYVNPQLWSHRITRALSSDIQHKLALDFNHPYSNSRKVFQAVAQQRNQILKKRFKYRLMWMGDDGPIEIARSNP